MPRKKIKRAKTNPTGSESAKSKDARSGFLVIVESPAKSKTINRILGKGYKVMASMGHIVDLSPKKMAVDFENEFEPEYVIIKGRKKCINDLKKEAKIAKAVYVAADPDREGEAICWHLRDQLKKNNPDILRVSFEEITEKAVRAAFEHPVSLDMNKVNAQQARRILDRIVGYSLSPLLWKKIARGLSAGRVQSVTVKMIVDREEEISKFKQQEYWTIEALLKKEGSEASGEEDPGAFKAKLVKYEGKKINVPEKEKADEIISELKNEEFIVADISRRERRSRPTAPYTTSGLQQDAFNKLNFSASKTMRVAQRLYEGEELGEEGSVGLITYMRTDSVRIANDAIVEVRKYIQNQFGEKYCPAAPFEYKSKKGAQEAHEAIRPTLPLKHPEDLRRFLNDDEFKLYNLIWKRFVASQMESALYSILAVYIDAGDYKFRAGGTQLLFDGFLRVYKSGEKPPEGMAEIPSLTKGETVDLIEIIPGQHFTKPPPRYSDAGLIKALEDKGIGRPSTYAPIIRTIITRNYVKRVNKYFHPTELGELVNGVLVENFPDVVDEEFTARMEDELDKIEAGRVNWVKVMEDFYSPFAKKLEEAKERMKSVKRQEIKTDEVCEQCGRPMVIKWGRRGKFLSCSGFPACRNAKSITTGIKCPAEGCDGELVERRSARGAFYGCTSYPECKYTTRKLPQEVEGEKTEDEEVQDE